MSSALCARIVTHMVESVRQTPTNEEPFPHIIVRNFFPADVYDDLLNFLPADDLYESFGYGKHHTADGQSTRLRFDLSSRARNGRQRDAPPDPRDNAGPGIDLTATSNLQDESTIAEEGAADGGAFGRQSHRDHQGWTSPWVRSAPVRSS